MKILYSKLTGVCCYGYNPTPSWCLRIFDIEAHLAWLDAHAEFYSDPLGPDAAPRDAPNLNLPESSLVNV